MIIVNIKGGLGNQLFQYAFGMAASKKLHTPFITKQPKNYKLPKYFQMPFLETLCWKFHYPKRLKQELIKYLKYNWIDLDNCNIDYTNYNVQNKKAYDGYFQSSKLVESNLIAIKKRFQIKARYKNDFQKKHGSLFTNKVIALHIRRTDYLTHGNGKNLGATDLSLPLSYYQFCLEKIKNISDYKIVITGDDKEYAQHHFDYLKPEYVFDSEINDFQVLLNSDILILSNSTFAWWAAMLNPKPCKQIFSPKNWLGFHINKDFPIGITSNRFEKIAVK